MRTWPGRVGEISASGMEVLVGGMTRFLYVQLISSAETKKYQDAKYLDFRVFILLGGQINDK